MASNIRSSAKYVWSREHVIREETNGSVYQGFSKEDPSLYRFIKVLSEKDERKARAEFDMLQILKHENIIRLRSLEKDNESGEHVMVMEYCNGGTLDSLLEQPENAFGFPDDDFRSVMNDIASGLKYLRGKRLVHRAIEPKNILWHEEDDGRRIFKLNDFGTARHLPSDASLFQTLYGHIDYQFPDMYASVTQGTKDYRANVVLWSVGVTLYRLATGRLPFQLHGGTSQDSKTLFQMTSNKPPGRISGKQDLPDGQFDYSLSLPDSCCLSIGLRNLITPLLAAILESDQEKIITYDKFFMEVDKIMSKRVVYVFVLSTADLLHVYCEEDLCFSGFLELLCRETESEVTENDVLSFDGHLLVEQRDTDRLQVSSLPPTSPNNPFFVLSADWKSAADGMCAFTPNLPEFPAMSKSIELEEDHKLAKKVNGDICFLRRTSADCHLRQTLVRRALDALSLLFHQSLLQFQNEVNSLDSNEIKRFLLRVSALRADANFMSLLFNPRGKKSLTKAENKLESRWSLAQQTDFDVKTMLKEIDDLIKDQEQCGVRSFPGSSCLDVDEVGFNCLKLLDRDVRAVNQVAKDFKEKLKWGELHENDKSIHLFDKAKLEGCFSECLQRVNSTCLPNLANVLQESKMFLRELQDKRKKLKDLQQKKEEILETLGLLVDTVDELQSEIIREKQNICRELKIRLLSSESSYDENAHNQLLGNSCHKIIDGKFAFEVDNYIYTLLHG